MGSNPAQGIKRFSSNENVIEKLSEVVRSWCLSYLHLNKLDCESICDPPVGKMRCWLERLLNLASIPDFQHCTDEAQKAETVLSAVMYIYNCRQYLFLLCDMRRKLNVQKCVNF